MNKKRKRKYSSKLNAKVAIEEISKNKKALIETSPDLIFVHDINGIFLEFYSQDETLLYLKPEQFIGKKISDIFPQKIAEKLNFYIEKTISTNELQIVEYELPIPYTNDTKIFEARIKKFGEDKIISIIRDITDRKLSELALEKKEARFRLISENIFDVIWVLDLEGNRIYVTPSIEQFIGFTTEEYLHQNIDNRFTKESTEVFKNELSKILNNKTEKYFAKFELEYLCKNGLTKWGEIILSPSYDGNNKLVELQGVTRDISERKQHENTLQQSEFKFRNIFNSSSDGIIIIDKNYTILNVNETLLKILDYKLEDGLGKHIFEFVDKKYIPLLTERAQQLFSKNEIESIEVEIISKSKKNIHVELKSKLTKYENENAVLVIVRDISERKSFERQILRNVIETEEKERMHFSQELHDGIGPLLSATKMYVQWLGMPNAKLDKSEILKDIEKLIDESARTVREISFKLSPHVLQNYGLVDATKTYAEKIKETSEIEIEIVSKKIERFDKNAETIAYRVICECINNTLKHAQASKISINIQPENEFLKVQYSDNGKGFDVNETLSKHPGIGLLNMQSRIKSINGFMEIKSTLEKGTIIIFNLKMHKNMM
ncbi:MAG TPA: hypothetical protein DDX39_10815 [Bacteroidales bacterium]|nr:MAG: hypothetical protein A2W98_13205 [Bacteroidetes bacterium GWF2_33_38]OFY72970.1 MAG: hypothetical protein A2265_06655 [Bacteroidetes bacterium RIFOXYA12_FULL_33_9]HBF89123.1 hypothetical protein [Bacteroidales bacterium]